MFYEITTFMVPVENFTKVTGYSDIIGPKWAKILNVDHIDLSHLDQNVVKRVIESIFEKKKCAWELSQIVKVVKFIMLETLIPINSSIHSNM